ncbi:DUF983 domain-containing protein [uncultured Paracoccus sp.]|uniref:DUF983 domain-containing protein n=1 Tax=uncultured Paracoccus sp. TaxID=189685 RepID=UPI0025F3A917|nr:DUF983 domain-containing protein [uncultured Paracoccus sp.]
MTTQRDGLVSIRRGLANRCPNCGEGTLFRGYLAIRPECEVCHAPLARYPAADGPAFFTMTIMLLLLIPLLGFTWALFRPSPLVLLASTTIIVTLLTLVVLRLVKGAFVGYLWAKNEQDRGA